LIACPNSLWLLHNTFKIVIMDVIFKGRRSDNGKLVYGSLLHFNNGVTCIMPPQPHDTRDSLFFYEVDPKSVRVGQDPANDGMYYIQNGYVGNAMCWWGKESCGYTTDITQAGRYSKEDAYKQVGFGREGEYAWPCKEIDKAEKKIVVSDSKLNFKLCVNQNKAIFKKEGRPDSTTTFRNYSQRR
jgi:hypothetical protein